MTDHSQTVPKNISSPTLCASGCGFFGSNATGGMCSTCWRKNNPATGKKTPSRASAVPTASAESKPIVSANIETIKSVDADNGPKSECVSSTEKTTSPSIEPPSATKKKSKKKKASYKSMMNNMLQGNPAKKDIAKEKEALRKVTGGGNFTKIDKI